MMLKIIETITLGLRIANIQIETITR
jgi:hypothetical protein